MKCKDCKKTLEKEDLTPNPKYYLGKRICGDCWWKTHSKEFNRRTAGWMKKWLNNN